MAVRDAYRAGFEAKLAEYARDPRMRKLAQAAEEYVEEEPPMPGQAAYNTADTANVAAGGAMVGGMLPGAALNTAGRYKNLARVLPSRNAIRSIGKPLQRIAKPFSFAGKAVTPLMVGAGAAETVGNYQNWKANPGTSFRAAVGDPAMAQVGDIAGYMGGPVNPVTKAVQLGAFATNPAYQSRRFAEESYDPDMGNTLTTASNALRGFYNPIAAAGGLTHSVGDWWKNRGVAQEAQQAADASQSAGDAARAANRARWGKTAAEEGTPAVTAVPGKEPSGTAKITKYEDRAPVGKTPVAVPQAPGTPGSANCGPTLAGASAMFRTAKRAADNMAAQLEGLPGPAPITAGMQQPKQTPALATQTSKPEEAVLGGQPKGPVGPSQADVAS